MGVSIQVADRATVLDQVEHPLSESDRATMADWLRSSSWIWTGQVDGKLACVWGLLSPTLLSTQGYIWLYTTAQVEDHEFLFVRHSQRMVEKMLKEFTTIVGHCERDAQRSRRWLRWLGAKFGEPEGKLIPFTIGRK